MKAYKKRAKASWNAGKRGKSNSDGTERQFSKKEITQQQAEEEWDYLEKYHKGKRTRNEKARLEHRIFWYEERIEFWKRHKLSGNASYFHDALRKAKKELAELIEKEKGQVS